MGWACPSPGPRDPSETLQDQREGTAPRGAGLRVSQEHLVHGSHQHCLPLPLPVSAQGGAEHCCRISQVRAKAAPQHRDPKCSAPNMLRQLLPTRGSCTYLHQAAGAQPAPRRHLPRGSYLGTPSTAHQHEHCSMCECCRLAGTPGLPRTAETDVSGGWGVVAGVQERAEGGDNKDGGSRQGSSVQRAHERGTLGKLTQKGPATRGQVVTSTVAWDPPKIPQILRAGAFGKVRAQSKVGDREGWPSPSVSCQLLQGGLHGQVLWGLLCWALGSTPRPAPGLLSDMKQAAPSPCIS